MKFILRKILFLSSSPSSLRFSSASLFSFLSAAFRSLASTALVFVEIFLGMICENRTFPEIFYEIMLKLVEKM